MKKRNRDENEEEDDAKLGGREKEKKKKNEEKKRGKNKEEKSQENALGFGLAGQRPVVRRVVGLAVAFEADLALRHARTAAATNFRCPSLKNSANNQRISSFDRVEVVLGSDSAKPRATMEQVEKKLGKTR